MPEKTAKPLAAAKVAKAKKPAKKTTEAAKLQKAVEAKSQPKAKSDKPESKPRPLVKLPYNLRTRSVVRTIVLAVEDPAERKATNAALRDLRKYSEIKAWADENIGAAEFQEVLESWFANGEVKG